MTEITQQWVIPTATNVIAHLIGALIVWSVGFMTSTKRISMKTLSGIANNATRTITQIALDTVQATAI